MNALERLHKLGQSVWYDDISRAMLEAGELTRYRDQLAVSGVTSNPTIFDRAISNADDYDDAIRDAAHAGTTDPEDLFFTLAVADIQAAADVLRPVYDRTNASDGFACLEVSPRLARDTDATIEAARRLWAMLDRPNVMVKVPGTPAGLGAIEQLTFEGINVNVTLLFSLEQWMAVSHAWWHGLERRLDAGRDLDVHSVASLFVSRIDRAANDRLPASWHNRAGVASAGLVYGGWVAQRNSERWQRLAAAGATPQRLLWASTSTKDPALDDTFYVESLALPDTVNTMPDHTLHATADHGRVGSERTTDPQEADRTVAELFDRGVDLERLGEWLQQEGVRSFDQSFTHLLHHIEEQRDALTARTVGATKEHAR